MRMAWRRIFRVAWYCRAGCAGQKQNSKIKTRWVSEDRNTDPRGIKLMFMESTLVNRCAEVQASKMWWCLWRCKSLR